MPTEARSNFMSRLHADTHFKTNTRAADDCELYKDGVKGGGSLICPFMFLNSYTSYSC